MDSHSTITRFITSATGRFVHIAVTGLAIAGWMTVAALLTGWLNLSVVVAGR